MTVSIICPITDREKYRNYLEQSLKKQTYKDIEIIEIDSSEHAFSSASEALNYGVKQSKGEVLIFAHQDVELEEDTFIDKVVNYCNTYQFAVGSVAGVISDGSRIVSSITHGPERMIVGEMIEEPTEIDACDECLFFMKRESFHGFEYIGDTWHLYAVNYCLQSKLRNERNMLFPLKLYHLSPGWSLNRSYWRTLLFLANKYRKTFDYIPTTFGVFKNNLSLRIYVIGKMVQAFI